MMEELKIVADIMENVTDGALWGVIAFIVYLLAQSILFYGSWVCVFFMLFRFLGKLGITKTLLDDGKQVYELVDDDASYISGSQVIRARERLREAMSKHKSGAYWHHKDVNRMTKALEDGLSS